MTEKKKYISDFFVKNLNNHSNTENKAFFPLIGVMVQKGSTKVTLTNDSKLTINSK